MVIDPNMLYVVGGLAIVFLLYQVMKKPALAQVVVPKVVHEMEDVESKLGLDLNNPAVKLLLAMQTDLLKKVQDQSTAPAGGGTKTVMSVPLAITVQHAPQP